MESYSVVLPNAISEEDIRKVEELCSSKNLIKGSHPITLGVKEHRKSEICFLNPDEDLWIFNIVGSIAEFANKYFNFEINRIDDIQYAEYDSTYQGYYDWHIDSLLDCEKHNKPFNRKLSLTVQLSDSNEYQGGDFELMQRNMDREELRKKGTAVVFPSYLEHRITPVVAGKRKSLVAWIEGAEFR